METSGARFDRAWHGCKCRGESDCLVCQACMTAELRAARNDALAEAAKTACVRCESGVQVSKPPGGILYVHVDGSPCMASEILDLVEPAGGD